MGACLSVIGTAKCWKPLVAQRVSLVKEPQWSNHHNKQHNGHQSRHWDHTSMQTWNEMTHLSLRIWWKLSSRALKYISYFITVFIWCLTTVHVWNWEICTVDKLKTLYSILRQLSCLKKADSDAEISLPQKYDSAKKIILTFQGLHFYLFDGSCNAKQNIWIKNWPIIQQKH